MLNGRLLAVALVAAGTLAFGCTKESSDGDMPAATEWNEPTKPGAAAKAQAGDPHAGMAGNPHAGMAGNPHAGMAGDPHAGMNMGGHAGSADIAAASGLQAPDPNAAVDPKMFLTGNIVASPATKARIKPEYPIYLSVKPYDPATKGAARVPPMAVDKLESAALPATFHLSGKQAMVQGTRFVGDVVITAHVSQTGDAMAKVKGDVVGTVRATIPAENLKLVLDTVIP